MTAPLAFVALSVLGAIAALLATQIVLQVVAQGHDRHAALNLWASDLGFLRSTGRWGTSQELVGTYRGHGCSICFVALGAELGSVAPLIQIRVSLDGPPPLPPGSPAKGGSTGSMRTRLGPLGAPRERGWFGSEPQLQELEIRLQMQSVGHLRCLDDELVYNIGEFDVSVHVLQDALDLMIETIETTSGFEHPRRRVN